MKIDKFMLAMGMPDAEFGDDAKQVLFESALAFRRAGGVISIEEWAAMSEVSKAALLAADERIRRENAAIFGLAAQGIDATAEVLSPIDDGSMQLRLSLERAVESSTRRMEKKA